MSGKPAEPNLRNQGSAPQSSAAVPTGTDLAILENLANEVNDRILKRMRTDNETFPEIRLQEIREGLIKAYNMGALAMVFGGK